MGRARNFRNLGELWVKRVRAAIASPRVATKWRVPALSEVQRRVTPWRELTRHCSLRPGGGRVCKLKRVGPSKVTSEAGLGGLGLSPRPLSSIGRMASADVQQHARGKEKVARSRSIQAL